MADAINDDIVRGKFVWVQEAVDYIQELKPGGVNRGKIGDETCLT